MFSNIHSSVRLSCVLLYLFTQFSILQLKAQKNPELTFFGNGTIQKALDAGQKIPANTGLGLNFSQWYHKDSLLWNKVDKIELEASINVASTVDTLFAEYDSTGVTNRSDFGSSILTPLNSGQAVRISLRFNLAKPWFARILDGFKAKYIGSNRNWMVQQGNRTEIIKGTNNCVRFGAFHEFIPKSMLDEYSINLGFNFAYNSIRGDVGLNSNDAIRISTMGTSSKHFMGPEFVMEIRLKNLRADFSYSWLSADAEVPGLTGSRMVTTISFVGGFGLK
jgi:hypothetical protein